MSPGIGGSRAMMTRWRMSSGGSRSRGGHELRDGTDSVDDEAGGDESILVGHGEGGVDPAGGVNEELVMFVMRASEDVVGDGGEPEVALDGAVGLESLVDEAGEDGRRVGSVTKNGGASGEEWLEDAVACAKAFVPKSVRDGHAFAQMSDVADDAEEVACGLVEVVGKRTGLALGLEGCDAVEDVFEREPCAGVEDVAGGVGKAETLESVGESGPFFGGLAFA